jgi:hypothetical protein
MLQYLIDAVHNAGMLAYAWFTSFNDNGYYSAFEESRTQPDLGEEFGKFVSPANDDVRAHELAIIKEFMIDKGFGFDGIRLDYLRYQSEEQPQDVAAVAKYDELYQKNLLQVISDRQGEVENWEQFLRWRASLLLSFTEEVKNLIGDSKRLGAYLMPHSGISEGGYITPNYAGNSYPNCWSGVDFELYKSLDMDIIPMLYWNDFHPIYEGDSKWDWVGGSMEHTQEFVSPNSNYMPCMSLSYENDEWAKAINIMRANNLTDIVVFHWAGGGYDQAVFDKINEIKHDANSGTGISITTDGNNATTLNSETTQIGVFVHNDKIALHVLTPGLYTLDLFGLSGRVVSSHVITLSNGVTLVPVTSLGIAQGVFIVSLSNGTNSITSRLFLE